MSRRHRHPVAERGLDLYETPACAVEALLRVEALPRRLWEPAAGRGAIVRVLRAAGHEVLASDIVGRDFELDFVQDFLRATALPPGCEAIVTNCPYRHAEQFIAKALDLGCPLVIMLLPISFQEGQRPRRCRLLEDRGLARIHVFKERLPMMHRDGWEGPRSTSQRGFGWYVWVSGYRGMPQLDRISWKDPTPSTPIIIVPSESAPKIRLRPRGRPPAGFEKGAIGTFTKRGSNSRSYIIARLERDGHLELAAKVRARALSARAAAHLVKSKPAGG